MMARYSPRSICTETPRSVHRFGAHHVSAGQVLDSDERHGLGKRAAQGFESLAFFASSSWMSEPSFNSLEMALKFPVIISCPSVTPSKIS